MRCRLLWADADTELLDLYQRAFHKWGFDMRVTGDAMDCVSLLREDDADVLVLDSELAWGGADGVLSFLRENRAPGEMPAVFVIGDPLPEVLSTRFDVPAAHCLRKPFRLNDVLDRINQVQPVRCA